LISSVDDHARQGIVAAEAAANDENSLRVGINGAMASP
jgi:hypothetical protein